MLVFKQLMKVQKFYNIFAIICATALMSCSEDLFDNGLIPDSLRDEISLSMSSDDQKVNVSSTRAYGPTVTGFGSETRILMRIQSEHKDNHTFLSSRTVATAGTKHPDGSFLNHSHVTFADADRRYWDDAHGRDALLSVYAIAIADVKESETYLPLLTLSDGGAVEPSKWGAGKDNTVNWTVNPAQTAEYILNTDLVYSNNIRENCEGGEEGVYQFNFETNEFVPDLEKPYTGTNVFTSGRMKYRLNNLMLPGVFDKGHMRFKRALTRLTVELVKGDGFSSGNFKFTKANGASNITNIEFKSVPCSGTFDVEKGRWDSEHLVSQHITQMAGSVTDAEGTYQAQLLPGKVFHKSSNEIALTFTIDGNTYYINEGMIFNALVGGGLSIGDAESITMEAGKNYKLTINVKKTPIDNITATLVDWEEIQAEDESPSNAYINVSVKTDEGASLTGAPTFALWRAPGATYSGAATSEGYNAYAIYDWEKSYEKSTGLTETTTSGIYDSGWYWPDNNTYYHFRTLSPEDTPVTSGGDNDYVSISGGIIKSDEVTAKDYQWGAPFKTTSPTPDDYSFDSGFCNNATPSEGQLYKAIGATEDNIKLIQHHMTAQVFFDIASVTGSSAVALSNVEVKLTNVLPSAQMYMGNGLITNYTTATDIPITKDVHNETPKYQFSYGVIPQQLNRSGSTVGLDIKTADGNHYIIPDITIAKQGTANVTEWLPGRKYYYKFTLSKTPIDKIEATIVEWETVTADNENVQIR